MKLSILLAFAALLAAGCRVGPDVVMWGPCSPGSDPTGLDGEWAMLCENGVWTPVMTADEYVSIQRGERVEIGDVPTRPTTTTTAAPTSTVPPTTAAPTTTTVPLPLPDVESMSRYAGSVDGGQTVEIIGTGFSDLEAVLFGGSAATVVDSSDDSITVTTPANSVGSVDVEVRTEGGVASPDRSFVYGAPPTLTDLNGFGSSGQITLTVSGSGFDSPEAGLDLPETTFWIDGNQVAPYIRSNEHFTVNLSGFGGVFNYQVTVTTAFGSVTEQMTNG